MNREEIIAGLRAYLVRETNFKDPAQFEEDTDLIALGVLDSLLLMSLVAHCEDTFGCQIRAEELGEDQVRSIRAWADTVMQSPAQRPKN